MNELRPLGDAAARDDRPPAVTPAPEELRIQARAVLDAEFERALETKRRLADETDPETARDKGRAVVASLEGAVRIALKLGLVDVATSRELFAAAQRNGLYEGWR